MGGTWNEEKQVYAIFTLNDDKKINGVYIGSATEIGQRVRQHINTRKSGTELSKELHEIMRAGAFVVRPLNTITFKERWQEYDWIRFFRDYTTLKIYNTLVDCNPDGPDQEDTEGGA